MLSLRRHRKRTLRGLKFIQIFMVDISGLVCKRLYIRIYSRVVSKYVSAT